MKKTLNSWLPTVSARAVNSLPWRAGNSLQNWCKWAHTCTETQQHSMHQNALMHPAFLDMFASGFANSVMRLQKGLASTVCQSLHCSLALNLLPCHQKLIHKTYLSPSLSRQAKIPFKTKQQSNSWKFEVCSTTRLVHDTNWSILSLVKKCVNRPLHFASVSI